MQNMAYYKAGEAFDSVIDGDDFDQVALIAGKKIVTSSEFNIDGKGLDLGDNAGFARAAFELSLDVISDVEQFGDSYYLIKTIKRIDPVILEFDLVKERVSDEVKTKLQKEQAKKDADLYLAKALDTNTLEQLGKSKLTSTKLFTRTGSIEKVGNSDEFIKAGFSLNKDNKIYSEIIATSLGYYIIGFKERKTPDESEISKNLETLNAQILRRKQAQSYQDWMAQLRKQNKITYNLQLLK
jgi:peptidyl-prolyl cis-trans isomerase D